jgi:hypothetical protein
MLVRIGAALLTSSILISGCGGGGSVGVASSSKTAPAHVTVADLTSCLRSGGATVTASKGEQDGAQWREEGEVEAQLGGIDTIMGVMADERGARHQLGAFVGLAGGAMVDGDRIEDHIGRVHNVSVLFSDVPDAATRRAVESCLGGPMRFDPAGP